MKFYFVTDNTIEIKDKEGKLLDITKEAIDAALDENNKNFTFDGKNKDIQYFYASEEEAVKFAKHGIADDATSHHAVLTLETELTEDEFKNMKPVSKSQQPKLTHSGGKVERIPVYELPADKVTVIKASFKHADENAKDVMYVGASANENKAGDKKDASKTSAIVKFLKKAAVPALTSAATGTAFWYAGAVPVAVAALAKLGLALPAASLATQIAIPAAVGLSAYAVGFAAWTLGKALVNSTSTAWKKFNRTNKEKYADDLTAATSAIKDNEKKLGLKEDSSLVVALDELLKAAPEAAFDDKGVFAKDEPKKGNRLTLAQWERDQLVKAVAANEADRPAILAEIRKGLNPVASK